MEAETVRERTAGRSFVERVEINGAALSRLVVPLATVLKGGGYARANQRLAAHNVD